MGTKLYVMPRGIERQGMTPTNPMKWTSKYGSVVGAIGTGDESQSPVLRLVKKLAPELLNVDTGVGTTRGD
jgi:hypothetical protein